VPYDRSNRKPFVDLPRPGGRREDSPKFTPEREPRKTYRKLENFTFWARPRGLRPAGGRGEGDAFSHFFCVVMKLVTNWATFLDYLRSGGFLITKWGDSLVSSSASSASLHLGHSQRERVIIGTQLSNLSTAVDTPAGAAWFVCLMCAGLYVNVCSNVLGSLRLWTFGYASPSILTFSSVTGGKSDAWNGTRPFGSFAMTFQWQWSASRSPGGTVEK